MSLHRALTESLQRGAASDLPLEDLCDIGLQVVLCVCAPWIKQHPVEVSGFADLNFNYTRSPAREYLCQVFSIFYSYRQFEVVAS